ncbi:MAG TPA: MEDS domain-containing protein, partial [Thermomicrobiales bacterium]|nr:MEDS domain-containing protein [Thermomicrobiales bacterium]
MFYEEDGYLLDAVADFVGAGFAAGEASVVALTGEHYDGLSARLQDRGFDLDTLQDSGQYTYLDAAETLPSLVVGDTPDEQRFLDIVGEAVSTASGDGRPVRVFGELVALLALDDNHVAAVQLEQFWNKLQTSIPFTLLCAYPLGAFGGQDGLARLAHVCDEHATVVPAESYAVLTTDLDRSRAVAELQRKAARLEAEIERRARAEEALQIALRRERIARLEAEAAIGVRDDFLSIAAHDLKTPVTILSGHAQLLQRQVWRDGYVQPDELIEAMDEITEQANNLTALVNRLLDTSRLEAGVMQIEPRPIDLAALTRAVVESRKSASTMHTISVSAPQRLAATLDPLRIE